MLIPERLVEVVSALGRTVLSTLRRAPLGLRFNKIDNQCLKWGTRLHNYRQGCGLPRLRLVHPCREIPRRELNRIHIERENGPGSTIFRFGA